MCYKQSTKSITVDDVNKLACISMNSRYDILDSILQKNVQKSISLLEEYYRGGGSDEELLFFLIAYFEKIYKISISEGMSEDIVAETVGIPAWLIRSKYIPRARAWGRGNLARAHSQLVKFDSIFKTSSVKRNHLYKFIFSLAN
jgi:DNA polymerase III delta subunit